MRKYQVTLVGNRTDTVDLFADSDVDVKSIYEQLSDSEIKVIKEFEYFNNDLNPKDTNYLKEVRALISNPDENLSDVIFFRYAKEDLKEEDIIKYIKDNLLIAGKAVTDVDNIVIVP